MNRQRELSDLLRDWKPPVELTRSAPREVRLSTAGIAMTVFSWVLLAGSVAAGALLWRVAENEQSQTRTLQEHGVTGSAVITRLWRTGGDNPNYRVAYEFVYGRQTYSGQSRPPSRIWRRLNEGGFLPVRFLPSDPTVNQPVDWQRRGLPVAVPPILAAVLAGAGLLMMFAVRRQKQLLSEGRPAPAVVTRHSRAEHGTKVPHYEFPLLTGSIARGKGRAGRRVSAVGDTICIVYDRDNPRRSTPYPMELVRLPDIPRPRRL